MDKVFMAYTGSTQEGPTAFLGAYATLDGAKRKLEARGAKGPWIDYSGGWSKTDGFFIEPMRVHP